MGGNAMRAWFMGIGLALAISTLAFAASDAPPTLITPQGFCAADGNGPFDALATTMFEKWFESGPGGKLLSFYSFCSGNPATAGFIAVAEAGAFEGSASSFIRDTCAQLKAIKEVESRDMEEIIAEIDQIARKDLSQRTGLTGRKVLKAALTSGVCYAFIRPEGKEPAWRILSYVPIRNKVFIVLRVYGVTGPSSTAESYRHLQQTVAALQQANP
jgi:hypothetical protein